MSHCVLIVDDEFFVRALASEVLESIGCEVTEAPDGTHALAALEQDPRIGVLISDINMPGMDGYELAYKARRLRQGLRVLLISGEQADGRGFPILHKPFVRDELISAVRRTMGVA